MARVYVGVGSNVEPAANVRAALDELEQRFGPLRVSTVYRTAPVGMDGQDFYNLAVGFDTDLAPATLVRTLHAIEATRGRRRARGRLVSRPLDLDLLLYDDLIRHDEEVDVPREDILEHAFVLCPLAEIAGERRHPETGCSIAALWAGFDGDRGDLRPVALGRDPQP